MSWWSSAARGAGRTVTILVLAALTVGCGVGEAGLGLPLKHEGEVYPGERRELSGTLSFDETGCPGVVVDGIRYYAIWPRGEQNGDRITLSLFEELNEGDALRGVGAFTPVAPLVADRDGYWAHAIGFCAPEADELLVLDSVEKAPD